MKENTTTIRKKMQEQQGAKGGGRANTGYTSPFLGTTIHEHRLVPARMGMPSRGQIDSAAGT